MNIVETLRQRWTEIDGQHGWMCVSEKEWNAYFHSFGVKHLYWHAALGGNTLSFRGCQLRVL